MGQLNAVAVAADVEQSHVDGWQAFAKQVGSFVGRGHRPHQLVALAPN
jgi:hypothetical protein